MRCWEKSTEYRPVAPALFNHQKSQSRRVGMPQQPRSRLREKTAKASLLVMDRQQARLQVNHDNDSRFSCASSLSSRL